METLNSFKGYGKMDPSDDRAFRKKTRRRLILIVASSFLLLVIITAVSAVLLINKRNTADDDNPFSPQSPISASSSIKAICSVTLYPESCYASLSAALTNSSSASIATNPTTLFNLSLSVASRALSNLSSFLSKLDAPPADARLRAALLDCNELIDDAADRFEESAKVLTGSNILSETEIGDLRTWLSATIADQETCLDGFEGTNGGFREKLEAAMVNSTRLASNSLAIVSGVIAKLHFSINRKLLSVEAAAKGSFLPEWATEVQRRVLVVAGETSANVTVARDGTGKVKSLQEAVDLVPKRNLSPFVIYVKAGEYDEAVVIDKSKWNVVMLGDGMDKTIVTSSKNFVDGTPTFSTATFAVSGQNFIAKDIGFKNIAGADKHQAVALRSGSDRSIFYRCSFDAFQDTLYAHSNRQFYRDCRISGTIDFIFGDAAALFQNCTILPRQPLPNQSNTITAQGKKDPNENTGFSIQGCTIAPYDADVTRPTFLGRPWKNYSTTVIMQSEIGPVVDPAGWLAWLPGVVPPDTINYAEYENTGPGASVAGRVRWIGYRPAIGADEASKFTVGSFFDGHDWISDAGVQFEPNL